MTPTESVPAGWYPEPGDPRSARWWDGLAWTRHVRVRVVPPAAREEVARPPAPWSARAAEAANESVVDAPAPHPASNLEEPGLDEPGLDEPGLDEPGLDESGLGLEEPSAEEPAPEAPAPARDLRWLRAIAVILGMLLVGGIAFQLLGGKLLAGLGVQPADTGNYGVGVVVAQANDAGQLPSGDKPLVDRVATLLEKALKAPAGSVDCTMSESLVKVGSTFPCTYLTGTGVDIVGSRLSVTITQGERVGYTQYSKR